MPQTITRRGAVDVEIVLGPLTRPLPAGTATRLDQFRTSAARHGYTVRTVETEDTITAIATMSHPADPAVPDDSSRSGADAPDGSPS